MTITTFTFTDDLFRGCKIKVKISPEMSMTSIKSQVIERLLVILDNFGFEKLVKYTTENQWILCNSFEDLLQASEADVFAIQKL